MAQIPACLLLDVRNPDPRRTFVCLCPLSTFGGCGLRSWPMLNLAPVFFLSECSHLVLSTAEICLRLMCAVQYPACFLLISYSFFNRRTHIIPKNMVLGGRPRHSPLSMVSGSILIQSVKPGSVFSRLRTLPQVSFATITFLRYIYTRKTRISTFVEIIFIPIPPYHEKLVAANFTAQSMRSKIVFPLQCDKC